MKYGVQKRMIHLPYSRELSLLLAFERVPSGDLRIYVFYNGETLVETMQYKIGRPFSLKAMTYSTYQGVLYVCFGIKHSLYRFKVEEDALVKFNDQINKIYEDKQKEIEAREAFIEEHRHDFRAVGDEFASDKSVLEDLTSYYHHQQVVEKVKLEHPDILKPLFAFEALEWPVMAYTPQRLTEMLQMDAEKVNDTLEKASEEEKDKEPSLLRVQVVAPFADRLWGFGSPTNTHQITASAKGDFSDFDVAYPSLVHARNPLSPIVGTFVSETFDAVLWSVPFGEELLIGTTDGIYVLKEGQRDKGEFIKIHKELNMGVAPIKPVLLDKALFFVEGNRKNISCLTWSRERGGYQVHSLTAYADHLFTSGIVRLEAVRTPFNMLFVLLGDGHFTIFTHDADLKILGWTQHYLGGNARVIDMCVITTLKDDKVFFWCVRDKAGSPGADASGVEYLEVLDTGRISSCPTLVRETAYLDCSSKLQDSAEIVIDKTVKSLMDSHEFFEELDMTVQGYAMLSKQLHHQVDRDARQFDIKDFLIDGVPWENLANGVFIQGEIEDGHFIPHDLERVRLLEDEGLGHLLNSAEFIKGGYKDGLFVENYPIDGVFPDPPLLPQFLYGKLVGADPLKWESGKFLERYFKTTRKATLKNIGRWSAFLQKLQDLIRLPQNMSVQNFNFHTISRQVDDLRRVLEEIKLDASIDPFPYLVRDFIVTHKTKPHINFHSQKEFLVLKESAIDEFHKILDMFLRLFEPFLNNIGLRNDFETVRSFVTHINKSFLEFMAGFESRRGNFFEQISFLSDKSQTSQNFWQNAFSFDLVSKSIFATKEIIFWLKTLTETGYYKGKPFKELDTERKVLFLKMALGKLLEDKEEHVKIRPQTQFVPRNMNLDFMDKTQIILDVCASLGLDTSSLDRSKIDLAEAADALAYTVKDGSITPTIQRRRGVRIQGQSNSDDSSSDESLSFGSDEDSEDDAVLGSSSSCSDEDLNRAIEGGDPEPVAWDVGVNAQRDYDNLMLQLYSRMNTVRNYIERHYLLLSDQGDSEKVLNLWAEKNTFRFFKYCFLDLKNMSLYEDLFHHVSLDTYTDLVQADSGERTVFNIPSLNLFPTDKLTLVADNAFYEHSFTVKGDQIKLTKPIKAFSIGFKYTSLLKLFPLAFNEEVDSIPKRNVTLGIKVYNTKDGWVEERQEDGILISHPLRSATLPHNHFNYHTSDSGYLVREVAAILAPPYQSGWLEIPMKEGIKRDICVTITVDTPAPFTLLKVSAKAQLLDRYKV
jgi:hypothetical protein